MAGDVHLDGRLREREVGGTQARLALLAEYVARELVQHALQIAQRDVPVDDKAFHLVEHGRVRRVVVRAEHPARAEHLDGRFLLLHQPDLPRARLRAQQEIVRDIEGILHVAGGVIGGRIERREVVVVVLDLRPFKDLKPHAREHIDEHIFDARDGVQRADGDAAPGHGDVHRLARELFRELLFVHARLQLVKARLQFLFQGVDLLPEGRALLGRDLTDALIQRRQPARPAQKTHSGIIQFLAVVKITDGILDFRQKLFEDIVHTSLLDKNKSPVPKDRAKIPRYHLFSRAKLRALLSLNAGGRLRLKFCSAERLAGEYRALSARELSACGSPSLTGRCVRVSSA